jgi:hypothetical protein
MISEKWLAVQMQLKIDIHILKYASKVSGKSDIEISALENPLSLLLD